METQPPGAVSSNPADPVLLQEPRKNPELERPPQAQPIFGSEIANVVDDDVEATRQKILDDILSTEEQKIIPENFEAILNPIYFDFAT